MTEAEAEVLALQALAVIAALPEAMDRLLATTGLTPEDLRRRAGDPTLLAGVLDHLLDDEPTLLDFCNTVGIAPAEVGAARRCLPGGGP